jgi:predicted Zn-dependent protease
MEIRQRRMQTAGCAPRLILALVVAGVSAVGYWTSREWNPFTEEKQAVAYTPDEEVALGMQAVPEMAAQFGGQDRDAGAQAAIDRVGRRLLERSDAGRSGYPFEFTVLADRETVNAFALPGGPIFITRALFDRLETEGQLAGVLGHEIVHVVARHSSEQIAKAQFAQGVAGGVVIASGDPDSARGAMVVAQMVQMNYGREDELQSDKLGVKYMAQAGYDPRSMVRVMEILAEASGGRGSGPDFFSTHPSPDRRIERIQAAIDDLYKEGVPSGLER